VRFVLDAFNGKTEEILSRVRDDNYGTLKRQVEDAYGLVNGNGAAFRNARITPQYLQVRLEELRWAAVAQELKQKEREEQRLLKERIRDEERAQKEFEKALKDTAREEETLRKAMEKVRADAAAASDEQRAKYEAELARLNERLKEAEERNQRAISMAQQTRSGHVYVISNIGSFGEHVYKIGMTRRLEPTDRIRELGDASVPFGFDIHAMIRSDDAPTLERQLQQALLRTQMNKVNPRKEFFKVNISDIKSETEKRGIQVAWTM
jgi:DNA repair exonuclease SbcCD ATPase subunit